MCCRRFASSGEVTAEEEEQRVLYTNVLEYEQDHVSWAPVKRLWGTTLDSDFSEVPSEFEGCNTVLSDYFVSGCLVWIVDFIDISVKLCLPLYCYPPADECSHPEGPL